MSEFSRLKESVCFGYLYEIHMSSHIDWYHHFIFVSSVLPGAIFSSDFTEGEELETAAGETITVGKHLFEEIILKYNILF